MHRRITYMLAIVASIVMAATTHASQMRAQGQDRRVWMALPTQQAGVHAAGVQHLALVNGAIYLTGVSVRPATAEVGARLECVEVMNPRLGEVVAVRLRWRVYWNEDLTAAVARGVTAPTVFDPPLCVRSSSTIELGIELGGLGGDGAGRLEIGVEMVQFADGTIWESLRYTTAVGGATERQPN
jgi:hypothetical protein